MKRKKWIWITAAGLLLMLLTGCTTTSDLYSVDRVDARAYIMPDGDLYIEEIVTYNFHREMNGMERYVETLGHGGIEFFEAHIPPDGKELCRFCQTGLEFFYV